MELHFERFPEQLNTEVLAEQCPLVIIPGLFGSTTNWRSFARKYAEVRPVIVIDQRNHGRSLHASSHSYDDMVNDLLALVDKLGLKKINLCGHSMGGKVAMLFTIKYSERVTKLIVLDIAPITYIHSHAPFLEELMQLDLNALKSRNEADRALQDTITDTPTRLFLLQSLRGFPSNYRWNLNLPVLNEYMNEIIGFPKISATVNNQALFVAGERSNYLLTEHHKRIVELFSNTQFISIADAGHWLHAEQPERVLSAVQEFVEK